VAPEAAKDELFPVAIVEYFGLLITAFAFFSNDSNSAIKTIQLSQHCATK
jgi:hypothetical protein